VKIKNQSPIRHPKLNKSVLHLLSGFACILLLPQANAAEVTERAMLTTGLIYDSNPAVSSTQKNPAWIFSLIPDLRMDVTSEVNQWFVDGSFDIERPSNQTVLINREDPRLSAGWNHTYESGLFGINANFTQGTTLNSQLIGTGLVTQNSNTQTTRELAANWQQTINSKWSALTNAVFDDVGFTISTPGGLESYRFGDIGSKITYQNNEKLDTYAQLGYAQINPNIVFRSTDKVRLGGGADYTVNENLTLGANAEIYNLSGRQSDTSWDGGINAKYSLQRASYSAALVRQVKVSPYGGFQKDDGLILGWTYARSELDQFGADYSFSKYIKDTTIGLDGLDYQQLGVFYERNITNHWKTRLFATFKKIDSLGRSGDSNAIGATLVFDTLNF
jgi:hypothetical protein